MADDEDIKFSQLGWIQRFFIILFVVLLVLVFVAGMGFVSRMIAELFWAGWDAAGQLR